jgi:hypothetical protein
MLKKPSDGSFKVKSGPCLAKTVCTSSPPPLLASPTPSPSRSRSSCFPSTLPSPPPSPPDLGLLISVSLPVLTSTSPCHVCESEHVPHRFVGILCMFFFVCAVHVPNRFFFVDFVLFCSCGYASHDLCSHLPVLLGLVSLYTVFFCFFKVVTQVMTRAHICQFYSVSFPPILGPFPPYTRSRLILMHMSSSAPKRCLRFFLASVTSCSSRCARAMIQGVALRAPPSIVSVRGRDNETAIDQRLEKRENL